MKTRHFTDEETANVPVLGYNDVIKLRVHDFYDYARSFELEFDGIRYWAEEEPFDSERYVVLELTDELWAVIDEMNADFRRYIGDLWEYDRHTQTRNIRSQLPHTPGNMNAYYDKWGDHDVHCQPFNEGIVRFVIE